MSIQQLLSVKGVVVVLCLLGLFVAERLIPAAVRVNQNNPDVARIGRNMSLWGINALLSPAIVIPITAFASAYAWDWRPQSLTGVMAILIDIVVLDLWIYWWHRVNHIVPIFWRFHRVHHMDEWLDVTSSVRFHFGEVVFSALARMPVILLMGIPLVSVIVFETLILVMSGFQHSNVRLPTKFERAMSKVFITPSIHWVHHHVLRSDTNSNYGTLFSFWDRLFGSRSKNTRQMNMLIGLDDAHEKPLVGLLGMPFQKS